MSGNLFSEFTPSNKANWKMQAEREMKGPLSAQNLLKIQDNASMEPYLTAEDNDWQQIEAIQKSQKKIPGWLNVPTIKNTTPELTNSAIRSVIKGGAQGILLSLKDTDLIKCEFNKLLHSIRLSDTPVYFETSQNINELFGLISNGAGYYIKGGIAHDPIANWMRTGEDYCEPVNAIALLSLKTKNMREFHPVMIESHVYHNAGATAVQELAFMTGTLVSYMDMLTESGISPLQAINRFFFSVSAGTEYLTEIAKLRALRFLYQKISRAYHLPDNLCNAFIHVSTSSFYNTEQMPYNNMLRSTSEAMSAIIGGCNALTVKPFNHTFSEPDDFADRIARNVSLIIANESFLGQVADPSAGSYFIENLTIQMADAAWKLFVQTEKQGGLAKSFSNGFVQDEIEKSWNEKLNAMSHDRVMVGINKYIQNDNSLQTDLFSSPVKESKLPVETHLLTNRNLAQYWGKKKESITTI